MSLKGRDSKYVEDLSPPSIVEAAEPLASPETKTTTRWELWAFYLYYVVRSVLITRFKLFKSLKIVQGNSGLSGFNFGPSQFQNLLYLAGYDPAFAPYEAPCGSGTGCVLPYLGSIRDGS